MKNEKTIKVVLIKYEVDVPFPEAEHYPAYVEEALIAAYPGYTIEVSTGLQTQVGVFEPNYVIAAGISCRILGLVKVELWDSFCAEGYKAYSR